MGGYQDLIIAVIFVFFLAMTIIAGINAYRVIRLIAEGNYEKEQIEEVLIDIRAILKKMDGKKKAERNPQNVKFTVPGIVNPEHMDDIDMIRAIEQAMKEGMEDE